MQRDHGGDIDRAKQTYGGADWIDLSTGINRRPYRLPPLSPDIWQALPTESARRELITAAARWFGCAPNQLLPMAGASAAIQLLPRVLPRVLPRGHAAVISPSYNEHAASLRAAGWQVRDVPDTDAMQGADLAVVVNPNNPDGRDWSTAELRDLAGRVGHLIVDESFADARPDLSLASDVPENTTILRSFGKFWGLAGLRLGFVIAAPDLLARLQEQAGPWAVNGPALQIGTQAMADAAWADATVVYLSEAALRLDRLALRRDWRLIGGTHLFRTYDTADAAAAQSDLARAQIWTRRFPYSTGWLRMGIPGDAAEWDRVTAAMRPA